MMIYLFELFLECPGSSEFITASGLGSGRLGGSAGLVLWQGRHGRLTQTCQEVSSSSSLATQSFQSRETMQTREVWQTILRNWMIGQKIWSDANLGLSLICLHVRLVIRSIFVVDIISVRVVSEVGATVSRTLWFVFTDSTPRWLQTREDKDDVETVDNVVSDIINDTEECDDAEDIVMVMIIFNDLILSFPTLLHVHSLTILNWSKKYLLMQMWLKTFQKQGREKRNCQLWCILKLKSEIDFKINCLSSEEATIDRAERAEMNKRCCFLKIDLCCLSSSVGESWNSNKMRKVIFKKPAVIRHIHSLDSIKKQINFHSPRTVTKHSDPFRALIQREELNLSNPLKPFYRLESTYLRNDNAKQLLWGSGSR